MKLLRERFAREAEALVGCPYRLHGREPNTGLDCIGLATYALARCGIPVSVSASYSLRNLSIDQLIEKAELDILRLSAGAPHRGDIVLVRPGPAQHHLLIATGPHCFVHAHAGIRRVVHQRGTPGWPITHHWQLAG